MSLSQHCSALPLALVLGVASTPDVVQRWVCQVPPAWRSNLFTLALSLALAFARSLPPNIMLCSHLPRAAITRLATQRFRLRHSPRILTDFTTKVLMDPTARVVLGWR